ncbi:MAG: type II secretion system protein [Candidatus Microgenomates bacterium]
MSAQNKYGFTLIELLLVIAIVGILAAVVAAAINPGQKVKMGNDSKVRSDVGQLAGAIQSYYTNKGFYPAVLTDLTANKELNSIPVPPTNNTGYGTAYTYTVCSSNASAAVSGTILAGNPTTNVLFCWRSSTVVAADTATCPCP